MSDTAPARCPDSWRLSEALRECAARVKQSPTPDARAEMAALVERLKFHHGACHVCRVYFAALREEIVYA